MVFEEKNLGIIIINTVMVTDMAMAMVTETMATEVTEDTKDQVKF